MGVGKHAKRSMRRRADVAAHPTRAFPGAGAPLDAASAVLWILLAVPLFLPGARRA
jgi:hypothetical protein